MINYSLEKIGIILMVLTKIYNIILYTISCHHNVMAHD